MDIERLNNLKLQQYNMMAYSQVRNDFVKLIDAEIARQSVTDEAVNDAINEFESALDEEVIVNGLTGVFSEYQFKVETIRFAIAALQAYQPWIPVSERLPARDDANEKEDVLCLFSDGAVETWHWDEICKWNDDELRSIEGFGGITHWRSTLPEPQKGE